MANLTRRTMLQSGGLLGAILALDAVGPTLAGANPAGSSVRFKAIDDALQVGVSRSDVAGVIAVAATPKGVVYEAAFGKANIATGAPMTLDTVFWLLSMTKAFTATACMQLIEQGRLRLDADAAKYLPELASPQVLEGFAADPDAATAAGQARDQSAPSADAYLGLHLLDLERSPDPLRESNGHARYRRPARTPRSRLRWNSSLASAGNTASAWTGSASWSRRCPISRSRSISARTSSRRSA